MVGGEGGAQRLLEDAQALIRLASDNPPGDETAAAAYVAERLRALGAAVELQAVAPGRWNAVGRWSFGPGPTLLFNSHLDVVPVERPEQREPLLRDGRLYGRGACDAKGPLAAMLAAAARLAARPPSGGSLVLAAVADEEAAGAGSRHLVGAAGLRADAAVVGEPTDNAIHLGCRGAYRARVRFLGRAAHSSDPDQGENANYHAARFLLAVEAWHRRLARRRPPAAASANVVAGGSKVNIVADACAVDVERRLGPGEGVAAGRRELERLLAGLARRRTGRLRWELEVLGTPKPSHALPAEHPFARLALGVAGQAEGGFFRGGTDAPYLAAAGIPAVIAGPGGLDQAHTADEWVGLAALEEAADLYERLARAALAAGQ